MGGIMGGLVCLTLYVALCSVCDTPFIKHFSFSDYNLQIIGAVDKYLHLY